MSSLEPLNPQDRQYVNLLTHLRKPSPSSPLATFENTLPHYLSQLAVQHVTTLAATVMVSSVWQPPSAMSTSSLSKIFRDAAHLRVKFINDSKRRSTFDLTRSVRSQLRTWINAVIAGCESGDIYLRSAIIGGVLLGIHEIDNDQYSLKEICGPVENKLVVAFAEILQEATNSNNSVWNSEYRKISPSVSHSQEITLLLFADHLLQVPSAKWAALDLRGLVDLCFRGLNAAFHEGAFLQHLPNAHVQGETYHIPAGSEVHEIIKNMVAFSLFPRVPPLSRILAQCTVTLAEMYPRRAQKDLQSVANFVKTLSAKLESDWKACPLASIKDEEDIGVDGRPTTTLLWMILKTLLFSLVMVSQSILTALAYGTSPSEPPTYTAAISSSILFSLSHLAFIITKVGGVTSISSFIELKRCFSMAIDCLSVSKEESENFVQQMSRELKDLMKDLNYPYTQAKLAFCLVCIEQLMPELDVTILESHILPICVPLLNRPEDRETYESAHSVMLSIFGTHATKRISDILTTTEAQNAIIERLVPFYCESLLENAKQDRLSTAQLQLAYSNLVGSATQCETWHDELAWLCVDGLMSEIESYAHNNDGIESYAARLRLTLVSLIPSVSFRVLPGLLNRVDNVLRSTGNTELKSLLFSSLKKEITDNVADSHKEYSLNWWDAIVVGEKTRS